MGDNYHFRDVTTGTGGVNIGRGNVNAGRDHQDNRTWQRIDNRGGTFAGGDITVSLDADLESLGRALEELRLTAAERERAARALEGAKAAAAAKDQAGLGGNLRRFTEVLKDAGGLAGAGATVIDALTRIGRWLGPIGAAVLALL